MKELQKTIFPNLYAFSYSELIEIFSTYALYNQISDEIYEQFEKYFIKNISRTTINECIMIMLALQHLQKGSQRYLLLMDHKLLNTV